MTAVETLNNLDISQSAKSSIKTLENLTHPDGKDAWIFSMRVSLVRAGLLPKEDAEKLLTDGQKLLESSMNADQKRFFLSALQILSESMKEQNQTFQLSAIPSDNTSLPMLPAWVRRILGEDIGLLHTPTTKANQCATSMQKWPCCRRLTAACGGKLHPEFHEWMMGWPIGFTDLR